MIYYPTLLVTAKNVEYVQSPVNYPLSQIWTEDSIICVRIGETFKKTQTRPSARTTLSMSSKLDDFRLSEYDWMSAML